MSTQGLDVSRIVNVTVTLTPQGAQVRNFGLPLLVGDSNVISGVERIRSYSNIAGVATDFGTSAPEYLAALLFFSQSPTPAQLLIGRWLHTATSGFIDGGILTATEQLMSNWTSISNGSFTIHIDGSTQDLLGLDFTTQTNLNGVAAVITAGLSGATCTWNGEQFVVTSASTGVTSIVSYATPEGTGTDISAQLKLDAANASVPVPGFAAETALEATVALYNFSSAWYIEIFASSVMPSTSDYLAVAAFIQTASISRVLFVTDGASTELDPIFLTNISQQFKALEYDRSAVSYCSTNAYEMSSVAGRMATVDFDGSNTLPTYMFKTLPGVTPETITNTQADTLEANNCNVYVNYVTGTPIFQYGVMSYNLYIDERQSFDWLQNAVQIAVFNLLLETPKIGQTDAGMTTIVNTINSVFSQAVTNGMIAPGIWNGPSFGNIVTGQNLQSGYYTYAPPISSQSQVSRNARISVPIQCAIKLAGAIQTVDILINVNR